MIPQLPESNTLAKTCIDVFGAGIVSGFLRRDSIIKHNAYLDVPEKLQSLYSPARYKIYYGGRGGAKSWSIARALVELAAE